MTDVIKKIFIILSVKERKKLIGIFFLILVNAILDLAGISTILPIVSLLTDGPSAIPSNFILSTMSHIFNTSDVNKLATLTLCLLIVFYFFKTIFMFLYTYVTNKFSLDYSRKLTRRLMQAYLNYPYEYHLNNNSSTLINKSTYDVNCFTASINCILQFGVYIITSLSIVIYLFISNWITASTVFSFLIIFMFVIIKLLKPHTKKVAKYIQQLSQDSYKYLGQAFNGIKESKISNSENYFVDAYDQNRGLINKASLRNAMYSSFPAHTLELVGMLGLCVSLMIIISLGVGHSSIISTFAVFVYAVIKLLPCVINTTSIINNFNFYKVSINTLFDDLNEAEKNGYLIKEDEVVDPLLFNNSIDLENVCFYYSSIPDKLIINNASLTIQKNTSVAFSGASGAGKTTIIDLILGLLPAREGYIKVDGVNINDNMRGWRTNISYIPQTIYLSDDTIRNNIAFGIKRNEIDDNKIWDALEKAQLKEYAENLPNKLDTLIGERGVRMSGGQRQRIGIARAFYRNTNIIVFDEATSALDYETEKNILDHVSKYSKDHTLIIITHRLNTIESCDAIYKVENGNVLKVK